jgi:hypothetical protein
MISITNKNERSESEEHVVNVRLHSLKRMVVMGYFYTTRLPKAVVCSSNESEII